MKCDFNSQLLQHCRGPPGGCPGPGTVTGDSHRRQSRDNHMTVTVQSGDSHGSHGTITGDSHRRQSRDSHRTITGDSHGTVTGQSRETVTGDSHGTITDHNPIISLRYRDILMSRGSPESYTCPSWVSYPH